MTYIAGDDHVRTWDKAYGFGFKEGYHEGTRAGNKEGFSEGHIAGYSEGFDEGVREGDAAMAECTERLVELNDTLDAALSAQADVVPMMDGCREILDKAFFVLEKLPKTTDGQIMYPGVTVYYVPVSDFLKTEGPIEITVRDWSHAMELEKCDKVCLTLATAKERCDT
jgi:hypothetical protein